MTTQDKLVRRKLSLIELAEFLKNVSQACKINSVSRQHFYDIKKEYDEQSETISRLEQELAEQARTIEKLQHLVHQSGPGNDELIHQFQGLINEQSRQFKQLTASVGEFIKASAEKAGSQK